MSAHGQSSRVFQPAAFGRPATPSAAGRPVALYLRLLGHLQRVVNFDPEVPHGALELGVPK